METLQKYLDVKDAPQEPAIIVYNPKENVILLIRKTNRENIEKEMKYCNADLKMFMLLLWDELKESEIKIIPLVASTSEVNEKLNCGQCTDFVVSVAELEMPDQFTILWERLSTRCDVDNTNKIAEVKVGVF